MSDTEVKRWWLSWYATKETGPWTLHSPWWISGERVMEDRRTGEQWGDPTVVAAVIAPTEDAAKEIILAAHDKRPSNIEWRFCEEQQDDWSPFGDRFPRGKWMRWPK